MTAKRRQEWRRGTHECVRHGLLVLSFLVPALLRAETNLERGKRLVNECISTLGGDRFLHMQDRVEAGRAYSFYRERLSGLSIAKIYTHYLSGVTDTANTLAVTEREFFGKKEDSSVLFTPDDAWEITFRGARPIPTEQFNRYKESTLRNILYILRVRRDEPGMIFESRGADVLDNRPVEIVDVTDAQNRTTTVYFDQTNKYPLRQVFTRRDPVTKLKDEEVSALTKYRDIGGGVLWPFDVHRERSGEKIYEMFSEEVELDYKKAPPNLFVLPSDVKKLKAIN